MPTRTNPPSADSPRGQRRTASLSWSPLSAAVTVDAQAGIIRNAAVMTVGRPRGHGFDIDATTLQQTQALLAAMPDGVEMRFKHPEIKQQDGKVLMADALGSKVGRLKNPRIEGDSLRGDVHLGEYAKVLPGLGDVWTYLLSLASSDPEALGLSAVIDFDVEPQPDPVTGAMAMPARVFDVFAVDFVGRPAANPSGLLSADTPKPTPPAGASPRGQRPSPKGVHMHANMKGLLVAAGCDPNASDAEFKKFHDGLSADKRTEIDGKHAQFMAANPDEAQLDDDTPDGGADLADAGTAIKGAIAALQTVANVLAPRGRRQPAQRQQPAPANPIGDPIAMETHRTRQIAQLGAVLKVPDEVTRACIAGDMDIAASRKHMLAHLQKENPPVPAIRVGEDRNIASLQAALPDAIVLRATRRAGYELKSFKPDERAQQLASLSFIDMFRHHLIALGMDQSQVWNLSKPVMAELLGARALRRKFPRIAALAESSSDFPAITLDAINKSLRYMYQDAPRSWNKWCQRTTNPDFKNINRVVLSEAQSLVPRAEGKEIVYQVLTDSKETYVLAEYVGGIKLTRRSIINDDLDAFAQIPRLQANASARLEEDQAYSLLTTNPTMADGNAVFSSAHANLVASGSGAAPSVPTLQALETLIKVQKGLGAAAFLELQPKFLLVPTALRAATMQLIASQNLISVVSTTSSAPVTAGDRNPYCDAFEVIDSVRLNNASTYQWYMMADYRDGQINTCELCFLEDEPEPVARQETDFDTEDVKFAIRHTLAPKVIDYRGMASNAGE